MQEVLAQLFTYVLGVWRHRWLALVLAWVVALGGWVWVWQMPEAYVATARVYVDTNSVLRPLLRGLTIQPNVSQRISMLSRTLLSRPNLEKLMRMTDLDLEVETDDQKNEMLSELSSSVSLSASKDASLYYISVRDEDREVARRITQALITVFIESSLGNKRTDSSGAQDFLDQQIADYEQRLIDAEGRLAKFKQDNVSVLPGSGGDYYSRLQAAKANLSQARLQLGEMENRQRELRRQLDGEDPVFISSGISSSAGMSPLDTRIQSLRFRVDELLSRYTTKHPEVRQITALIEELEAEKAAELAQLREESGSGLGGYSTSPVYQGMRSMQAEAEASVAGLQVRVEEYQRRVVDLESKVSNIPEIEAKFKQLDRDYSVVSAKHQEMLQRRESAQISDDVEQNASDVVIRVIDPPFVPSKPSEPNRALLNGGVLLVAIAVGAGAALLMFLVAPVIVDAHTLIAATGLPLLGAITYNQKDDEKRAELFSLLTFVGLSIGLLLIYVGVNVGKDLLNV